MIQYNNLTIKPLEIGDAELLAEWLSDPKVLEFYEGRDNPFTSAKVREKFFKRNDNVQRNLLLRGNEPIGYIQYYPVENEDKILYGYDANETIYGLDQFIGETMYWGQGIGTTLVTMMKDYLFSKEKVERIIMDPQVWNKRAIACYEKCGFTKVKLLPKHEWHEGEYRDCWLIECKGNSI